MRCWPITFRVGDGDTVHRITVEVRADCPEDATRIFGERLQKLLGDPPADITTSSMLGGNSLITGQTEAGRVWLKENASNVSASVRRGDCSVILASERVQKLAEKAREDKLIVERSL